MKPQRNAPFHSLTTVAICRCGILGHTDVTIHSCRPRCSLMSPCYCSRSDLFGGIRRGSREGPVGDGSAQTGPGPLRVVHGAAEEEILTSITSSAFSVRPLQCLHRHFWESLGMMQRNNLHAGFCLQEILRIIPTFGGVFWREFTICTL